MVNVHEGDQRGWEWVCGGQGSKKEGGLNQREVKK